MFGAAWPPLPTPECSLKDGNDLGPLLQPEEHSMHGRESFTSFASPFASSSAICLLCAFSVCSVSLGSFPSLWALRFRISPAVFASLPSDSRAKPSWSQTSDDAWFCLSFVTVAVLGWAWPQLVLFPPPPAAAYVFITSTAWKDGDERDSHGICKVGAKIRHAVHDIGE